MCDYGKPHLINIHIKNEGQEGLNIHKGSLTLQTREEFTKKTGIYVNEIMRTTEN
jgi:hypothetical protein